MTVVLALAASLAYGVSDFAGGLASRRVAAVTVLLWSYPVGAVLSVAALPLLPGRLSATTALYGVVGGAAGLVGVLCLYSALARAPMNVVSPVTAVLSAVVPVLAGLATGERPGAAAWSGIALGLVAVVAVSRGAGPVGRLAGTPLALALVAGLGFGLYFVLLARADGDSGIWPLLVSRVSSAVLIVPVAVRTGGTHRLGGRTLALALLAGALDGSANLAFLEASRAGLLSLAGVLTSLYPAVTVLLAGAVLRERTTPTQRVGLGLAAAAVVLIAV